MICLSCVRHENSVEVSKAKRILDARREPPAQASAFFSPIDISTLRADAVASSIAPDVYVKTQRRKRFRHCSDRRLTVPTRRASTPYFWGVTFWSCSSSGSSRYRCVGDYLSVAHRCRHDAPVRRFRVQPGERRGSRPGGGSGRHPAAGPERAYPAGNLALAGVGVVVREPREGEPQRLVRGPGPDHDKASITAYPTAVGPLRASEKIG
jgi:hypothetical protein